MLTGTGPYAGRKANARRWLQGPIPDGFAVLPPRLGWVKGRFVAVPQIEHN
jgi:hypothetical protein